MSRVSVKDKAVLYTLRHIGKNYPPYYFSFRDCTTFPDDPMLKKMRKSFPDPENWETIKLTIEPCEEGTHEPEESQNVDAGKEDVPLQSNP